MDENRNIFIQTIRQMLAFHAERFPAKRALLYRTQNGTLGYYTYRKLWNAIRQLGTALLQHGLADKHIAIIGKNSVPWALSYLSVACGVGVAVPVDREMTADSIYHVIRFASVKAVFADRKTLEKLQPYQKKLQKKVLLFSLDEETQEIPSVKALMVQGEKRLNEGDDAFDQRNVDPACLAFLLFTSGTTGTAKAVMLSNSNICADLMSVANRIHLTQEDSTLCLLPLHHTYQTIAFLMMLYVGGTVSFCDGLRAMSRDLAFYRPTVIVSVPLLLEKMHKRILVQLEKQSGIKRAFSTGRMSFFMHRFEWAEFRKYVYSAIHDAFGGRLKMIVAGAASLNPDVAKDFASFGIPVVIGYGLTECSPIVMCNSSASPLPDTVGKPLDNARVILDNLDDSGVGEICVKGPMVMLGYYKNKKATAAVIQNGWFRTGDLAYCDDAGNYHITGRSKNVIVTKGGKNIYPEELEYYLNRDPIVLESLIFGEDTGDDAAVVATVVPDEDAIKEQLHKEKLSKDDIQKAVGDAVKQINRILPSYKSIRRVFIRDKALDKTGTQKLRRQRNQNPDEADKTESEESSQT